MCGPGGAGSAAQPPAMPTPTPSSSVSGWQPADYGDQAWLNARSTPAAASVPETAPQTQPTAADVMRPAPQQAPETDRRKKKREDDVPLIQGIR